MSQSQGITVKKFNRFEADRKATPRNSGVQQETARVYSLAIQRMKKAMAECEKTCQEMGKMIQVFRTNMTRVSEILENQITVNMQQVETNFTDGKEWANEDLLLQKKFQEATFSSGSSKFSSDQAVSDYLNAREQLKIKYSQRFKH
jgi:hypothetical protein